MAPRLLCCPSCECHVKASESTCPHCGSLVHREDNRVARSTSAVALGLSAVLTAAGCDTPMDSPVYGIAMTGTGGEAGTGGTGGMGGAGGAQGGMGGTAGMGGAAGMGGGGKGGSGGM